MDVLTAVLVVLVVIAVLFEVARRAGVPYPSLFVVGGLGLAFIPAIPRITLEPDLVLLVFLPPLLFSAAFEMSLRELRQYIAPITRLAVGLVVFTIVVVALVVRWALPDVNWFAALAFGAIVAPTDALAATTVFRRVGAPRAVVTLIEGEALFNDATALVAYRFAVAAAVGGAFVFTDAVGGFLVAAVGGIVFGVVVGRVFAWVLMRLDDPPVEVVLGLVIPFIAYLPADRAGLSGVLAAVAAGLVIGRRLGTILSPSSRVLWLSTWKMVGFVLNGFVFVLIGLQVPDIIRGIPAARVPEILVLIGMVIAALVAARFAWIFFASFLPDSPRRTMAKANPRLAWKLAFVVGWAGLRGAVSLAAALALPASFPERDIFLLVTFAVILVTLVVGGLSLPWIVGRTGWDGVELDGDETTVARAAAYAAGLAEVARARAAWGSHAPLFDRLESGLKDRTQHLATDNPEETQERSQEHAEHVEIQHAVIEAERLAVAQLRDDGQINDVTLRQVERELDLEELRMEA